VLTLVMDSLRYWVQEMHVDGFRFDLASTLGRERYEFEKFGGFFDSIHQDPVLSQVKLIAEPWDVGEGGYQVGNFPIFWSEWNDRFRDGVRAFWQTDHHPVADMGYRLTGSSDLYELSGRGPWSSINFIVSHDGYTLEDLVSYVDKHNEANGEQNQDGHSHNLSANYGVEGPTTDPKILAIRDRQKRNMLATLVLSQGVPMICGGDELGRTQRGNNNAYCQDNDISWFDWELDDRDCQLHDFVQRVVAIRQRYPILRRRKYFEGRPERPRGMKDLAWLRADGEEMLEEDWSNPQLRTLVLRMAGDALDEPDARGRRILTRSLLLVLHGGKEPIRFLFPAIARAAQDLTWNVILDTDSANGASDANHDAGDEIDVPGRTILLCVGGEDAVPH
jgi:isoamylase